MSINIKNKFNINIKRWALCGVVAFVAHTASYAQTSSSNNGPKKAQTEQKANSQPQTLEDSTAVETLPSPAKQENQKNKVDSEKNSTKAQDEIKALRKKRLKEAEDMIIRFIFQYEAFRSVPYQLPGENFETYNIGNTKKPDGSEVKSTDRIRSEKEARDVFFAHVYQVKTGSYTLGEAMIDFLPLEKMTDGQIAAMASMYWQRGQGHLYNKQKDGTFTPSKEAILATEYFTNPTKESKEAFRNDFISHNKVQGKTHIPTGIRRNIEVLFALENEPEGLVATLDEGKLPMEKRARAVNLKTVDMDIFNFTPKNWKSYTTEGGKNTIINRISSTLQNDILQRAKGLTSRSYICQEGDTLSYYIAKDIRNPIIQKSPKSSSKAKGKSATKYARSNSRRR